MLKKKILGIAVIGLTAIGFTYGVFSGQGYYNYADTNSYNTNGAYGYTVSNVGNFNTNYGNDNIKSFYWSVADAYGNGNFLYNIGRYNGKLYFLTSLNGTPQVQGFIQNICIKPISSRGNEFLHNDCTYNNNVDLLNSINTIDGYAFELVGVYNPGFSNGNPMQFCFSDGNNDYCIECGFMNNECTSGLTGTLNITDTDFSSLKDINWSNSPINGGGTEEETQITQYSCPTIQQLINTYGSDYTENLCYSSSLIYSGGSIQQITPKTIFELYPTYTGFTADISIYNTYCRSPNTTQACQTAFNGKDIEYTLLAKIPDNIKKTNLYQYCHLQLDYEDKNATTCTLQASGLLATGLNETITVNDIITEIGEEDYTVIKPGTPPQATGTGNGSGSVYDGLLGDNEDDTERWNIIENAKNIVQTMKELYAKFTGIFRAREGKSGFIPGYITGILLLIILFKLFKK